MSSTRRASRTPTSEARRRGPPTRAARRRRTSTSTACSSTVRGNPDAGITYPLALLIAAAALSLAAQLAVAKPGISGGLLAAVPALAFMALVKLTLSKPAATTPTPAPVAAPAVPPAAPAVPPAAPVVPPTVNVPTPPAVEPPTAHVEPPARPAVPPTVPPATPDVPPTVEPTAEPVAPATVVRPASARRAARTTPTATAHRPNARRPRHNRAEIRAAAAALLTAEPDLSVRKVSERLGVPRTTLREALNAA